MKKNIHFDLIRNDENILEFNRYSVDDTVNEINESIRGNGGGIWKDLIDTNPKDYKLRESHVAYNYYDLDGNRVRGD